MKKIFSKVVDVKLGGIPLPILIVMILSSVVLWRAGALERGGILTAWPFLISMGLVLYAIGEKLPIWNKFFGGGYVLAFVGGALAARFGIVSASDVKALSATAIENKFLHFALILLVGGSILSVKRSALLRSLVGYIPLILIGLMGAITFGTIGGLVFNVPFAKIITHYVLPIMGGGNGGGAIPMSEIYENVTGNPRGEYYGFAIAILTIANTVAIISASLLNILGQKFKSLSGEGKLVYEDLNANAKIAEEIEKVEPTAQDHLNAFYLVFAVSGVAVILYGVFSVIHLFAYTVILFILLNVLNIVPGPLKIALNNVMKGGLKLILPMVLFVIGLGTDVNELIQALAPSNVAIIVMIVFGVILFILFSSKIFKFYPIEAAITAGLCMANRGGSGDLEVLGASKRMELFPYAQISSRIGGGVILAIAGYLFSLLLK